MPAARTALDYAETALLEHLIFGTLTDDDPTTNVAAALLNATKRCPCCNNSVGWASLTVANRIVAALDKDLPGHRHHLAVSFEHADRNHNTGLHLDRVDGAFAANAEDTVRFLLALAAAVCQDDGGLTVRSAQVDAADQVRGWSIGGGFAVPLSRAEIFNAYCTDAATGEPIPPEPDTEYCDAFNLR
ncbi:hypothetical protein [Streptomyces tendae]|uniref:hypothetical protein n=1 Tax=Streptomyces tendae TaxID=1932 RepID=UPI003EBCA0EF